MAMTLIKKEANYKIFKRGDGRYAVQDGSGKGLNGEEKVRILVLEGLISPTLPAKAADEGSEVNSNSDLGGATSEENENSEDYS